MGRRLLGVLLASVLVLVVAPQVCLACSCRMLPPDEALAKADIVFRGRVARISSQSFRNYRADGSFEDLAQIKAMFLVDTIWKGPIVPTLSIAQGVQSASGTTTSSCEVSFASDGEYLVYASWQSNWRDGPLVLISYFCSATRAIQDAGDYLQALGKGTVTPMNPRSSNSPGSGVVFGAYEAMSPAITRGNSVPPQNLADRRATVFADFSSISNSIAVDRDGYVYAVDYAQGSYFRNRLLKLSPDGELVGLWAGRATGSAIDEFTSVSAVAVDQQGGIYLSAYDGVRKLGISGQLFTDWRLRPTASSADSGLLLVDSMGVLNVFTAGQGLRRFTRDGNLLSGWTDANRAATNGFFAYGMAVDREGNSYLTGLAGDRVQKFSPAGDLLATWGKRGDGASEFNDPRGIGVDQWGNVYVADSGNDRVQQFSPTGVFVAAWGRAGSAPGQFRRPAAIAVDQRGNVYVSDPGNFRIQRIPAAPPP